MDDTPEKEQAHKSPGALAGEISREIVRLVSRYTGRGPTKARTMINMNVVLVVLDDALTRAEQNLAAAGEQEAVIGMRRTFHHLMRDEVSATVEQLTGRKVVSFLSDVDPKGNRACQVFVLEARSDTDLEAATGVGIDDS
jgi:uncharacterized protein YbcI